jgi:hypothetical protein
VVKSADLRDRHNAPACWRLDFARMRAVVVEGLMRAGGVVVREVAAQQTAEVRFVDHDDVIEAFPTNRADDALGEGILPERPRRDKDLAYPQAFHPPSEHVPVDGIPIAEQVSISQALDGARPLDRQDCTRLKRKGGARRG